MGAGCPVCNGLTQLEHNCPDCGSRMVDYGGLESYCNPYGPYDERDNESAPEAPTTNDDQCVHLLQCPRCNETVTYPIGQELIV